MLTRSALLVLSLLCASPAWAAITFVGSAAASAQDGADAVLTAVAGVAQNDLVIIAYSIGDNDNVDFNMAMVTAGYTEIVDIVVTSTTSDINFAVYWKIEDATPDANPTVDGQGGMDASVTAIMMVFRGVDTTTPLDVTTTTATGTDSNDPDPPSIDHLNPAGIWTVIAGGAADTNGGASSFTFPTGYTTNALSQARDDTTDATTGMGYNTGPSDPEDPGVMTHSGAGTTGFSWGAATMALRPSGGAATAVKDIVGGLGIVPFAR